MLMMMMCRLLKAGTEQMCCHCGWRGLTAWEGPRRGSDSFRNLPGLGEALRRDPRGVSVVEVNAVGRLRGEPRLCWTRRGPVGDSRGIRSSRISAEMGAFGHGLGRGSACFRFRRLELGGDPGNPRNPSPSHCFRGGCPRHLRHCHSHPGNKGY